MNPTSDIKPEMPVVCSKGGQFAVVDHMQGADMVKLKKDQNGVHHLMPVSWVSSIEGGKVKINRPGDQAMREWGTVPKK